jgi:phosphate transport system substrate-binding protein
VTKSKTVVLTVAAAAGAVGGVLLAWTRNARSKVVMGAAVVGTVAGLGTGAGADVDPQMPEYKSVSGVAGKLSSIGSDTLNNLMTYWAEGFQGIYPNVNPLIEGKGSTTAPPALISGSADFGPMSREMKAEEINKFEQKFGYKPTGIVVALDALAVYVNKDNPVTQLTLQQVDAIFSSTRKSGAPADIATWGQAGLTGDWANLPISIYGRNSASGTYGYFKEHVLAKGDYKSNVKEQPGSAAVVQGVTADRAGIGYSGIGYKTSGVKAVPIVAKDGKVYEASEANVYSGKYPISRALFVYVNKAPGRGLQPAVKEFLLYVLSKQGQQVVVKDGYIPLPAAMVATERVKLN